MCCLFLSTEVSWISCDEIVVLTENKLLNHVFLFQKEKKNILCTHNFFYPFLKKKVKD